MNDKCTFYTKFLNPYVGDPMVQSNLIALVTGAGKGIGKAIAQTLAEQGVFVYINFLSDETAARQTLETILAGGGNAALLPFDVKSSDASLDAVKTILKENEKIDILVNNAGVRQDQLMAMMKKEAWQTVIDANLNGFYNVTKPVVKAMIKQKSGRIVNLTSAAGQTGNPGQVNYCASKAGLIGATKALAKEIGSRNITVNAVSPGFIQTQMTADLPLPSIEEAIPAKRLGRPEAVADLVAFLCSDKAAYITGQVIGINGGLV